jgi:hypothetical protein
MAAGGNTGPRGQVVRMGKTGHVGADLGYDRFGRAAGHPSKRLWFVGRGKVGGIHELRARRHLQAPCTLTTRSRGTTAFFTAAINARGLTETNLTDMASWADQGNFHRSSPSICLSHGGAVLPDDAGPWGDWLSCDLTEKGHGCWVVAPSRVPTTAGDHGTTDRRDAVPLARLMRSGALTASGQLRRCRTTAGHAWPWL